MADTSQSGAIIEYLIDTYDKENKLSYTEFPQKYEQKCWEHFQMSGQGPYFGQKAWFTFVCVQIPRSALEIADWHDRSFTPTKTLRLLRSAMPTKFSAYSA